MFLCCESHAIYDERRLALVRATVTAVAFMGHKSFTYALKMEFLEFS